MPEKRNVLPNLGFMEDYDLGVYFNQISDEYHEAVRATDWALVSDRQSIDEYLEYERELAAELRFIRLEMQHRERSRR